MLSDIIQFIVAVVVITLLGIIAYSDTMWSCATLHTLFLRRRL